MDVGLVGGAEDIAQAGTPDVIRNDLRGQGDSREEPAEFAGSVREPLALSLQNMLLNGSNGVCVGNGLNDRVHGVDSRGDSRDRME